MGVDFVIGYNCTPKEKFTDTGLLQRVKSRRAGAAHPRIL